MKVIKFDDDPKKNQELIDYTNRIIKENGIDNSIKKVKKLLSECEERRKQTVLNNGSLLNTDSHIELCKNMLEYLDEVKIETRDKKLRELLENKHILNFKKFKHNY